MDGVHFLLQVLHECPVDVPELARKYVVSVVGVDEDNVIFVAVIGNEILSVCYVQENAVMYASP